MRRAITKASTILTQIAMFAFCFLFTSSYAYSSNDAENVEGAPSSTLDTVINMNGVAQAKSVAMDANGNLDFTADDGKATTLASAQQTTKAAPAKAGSPVVVAKQQSQSIVPITLRSSNASVMTARSIVAMAHVKHPVKAMIIQPQLSQLAVARNQINRVLTQLNALPASDQSSLLLAMFAFMMTLYTLKVRHSQERVFATRRSFAFNTRMALHDILGFTQLLQEERAGTISAARKQYLNEIMAESKGILANLSKLERQGKVSDKDLSFDLRTELFSIIGFAQLFSSEKMGDLTSKQKEFISEVIRESNSILHLVPTA